MKTYIGVDLGTSGVKALAVDKNGKILAEAMESYPVSCPQEGWSEQDPGDWYAAMLKALKRLNAKNVEGISFGGQMHGLVILDKDDNVIRPCILWNDGRAQKEVEHLNSMPVVEYTGNIAFAGFTAPKILWVKNNEHQNFARIAKIMLPKDYLVYRLCGAFSTDYSDASGMLLLDVKNKCWSREMLAICGVSAEQLPSLHESYDAVGYVKEDIANMLGWGKVTVVAGAGDNAAAATGTGTVKEGDCNISLGTSGTLFIASDNFALPKNNALHSFAHANGAFHLMGCILSAASANKWWIEDISRSNYDCAEKARSLMGKNPVMFLPYLSGERCPHNDVTVRGGFLGLSSQTTREQMALAVMEGVAFALRDCLELVKECGIEVKSSTICGGGAQSAVWREVIANVLNVELSTVETEQGPAYGAAILAMVACGVYTNVQAAAAAIIKKHPSICPDEHLVELYNNKYKKYRQLYPLLKEWYAND